ncbi:hypothetical protein AAFC00_003924 [Neodothiora populina]|uniref:Cupin type-2 domain-containing protein n=1 Tax=Neodothiora populina TaxID=2781224 RepID=A0ABR3PFW9_9PEZI
MPSPLPNFQRLITGHSKDGKSILVADEQAPWDDNVEGGNAAFSLAYTTSSTPVDMNADNDLSKYRDYLVKPPGLVEKGGSVLRFVDMAPGIISPMHRTVSIDYGIVILGRVELVLDSGETKVMEPGDVCVQRGTMHAWRNASQTEWARMMYVLQPSLPVEIEGKPLEEELSHMKGVRKSS